MRGYMEKKNVSKDHSRQGLSISLSELYELKTELIKDQLELQKELGKEGYIDYNQKFLINIINKQPKCSDTWEIEK